MRRKRRSEEGGGVKGVHAVILDVDQRCAHCFSAKLLC